MGGCVTRYRDLSLIADSFDDVLQPDQVKFYRFQLTQQWLNNKRDLVVRVHVTRGYEHTGNRSKGRGPLGHALTVSRCAYDCALSSRLRGVYCARDRAFPNQNRKLWSTQRYCNCPSPGCDHCYPHCLNEMGGICTECMLHDDKFERLQHDPARGGLAAEQGQLGRSDAANGAAAAFNDDGSSGSVELALGALASDDASATEGDRLFDPPFPHQTDYEFSLRLSPTAASDAAHLATPGYFWLTVAAAPERVSRALRHQRLREGEEQLHQTVVSLWIEEAAPKGDPRLGNDARVAAANERAAIVAKLVASKREFGRKLAHSEEVAQQSKRDADTMREIGVEETKPERRRLDLGMDEKKEGGDA